MDTYSNFEESSDGFDWNISDGEIERLGEISDDEEITLNRSGTSNECLTLEQVSELINAEITEIQSITNLPRCQIKQLLNHFQYDKLRLLETFYEDGKFELFANAGIEPFEGTNSETFALNDDNVCEICFEGTECVTVACSHNSFCKACYTKYLESQIFLEASVIKCPAHKCGFVLDDHIILKLLPSEAAKRKFHDLTTSKFVTHNRNLKFCPQPKCTYVIKSEIVMTTVRCKCKHYFCFKCSDSIHEPVPCEIVRKWKQLVKADGGSKKWIYQNTKNCPRCSIAIEKNGGCNQMSCAACGLGFCWVCSKSTEGHDACEIGTPVAKNPEKYEDLDFDQYTTLYMEMWMMLRLEQKFYCKRNEERADWMTQEFIQEAFDVLYQNRRTLMYCYLFAYYIDMNNLKMIFEENLEHLRKSTEELSAILKSDVMERNVRDKTSFCDSRRKIIIDFVRDGYDQNYWKERPEILDKGEDLYATPRIK